MDSSPENVTQLLQKFNHGDAAVEAELLSTVYKELRRLAAHYMRRERPDHTLQATALVHEAFLRLTDQRKVDWNSRAHFFGVAAQLMRRILIDHARGRLEETAGVLGISPKTVKRDWSLAKAWLYSDLRATHGNDSGQVE